MEHPQGRIYDVSAYRTMKTKTQAPMKELEAIELSSELSQMLQEVIYKPAFKFGKYKTIEFEQVWAKDKPYFSWLLTECTLGVMKTDRENARVWLEDKLRKERTAKLGISQY